MLNDGLLILVLDDKVLLRIDLKSIVLGWMLLTPLNLDLDFQSLSLSVRSRLIFARHQFLQICQVLGVVLEEHNWSLELEFVILIV